MRPASFHWWCVLCAAVALEPCVSFGSGYFSLSTTNLTLEEAGDTKILEVKLTGSPTAPVTVQISDVDDSWSNVAVHPYQHVFSEPNSSFAFHFVAKDDAKADVEPIQPLTISLHANSSDSTFSNPRGERWNGTSGSALSLDNVAGNAPSYAALQGVNLATSELTVELFMRSMMEHPDPSAAALISLSTTEVANEFLLYGPSRLAIKLGALSVFQTDVDCDDGGPGTQQFTHLQKLQIR